MQHIIYIADELVLEAHPEGPYIVLRREGEPGAVRVHLNEVRAPCSMAAEVVGMVVR